MPGTVTCSMYSQMVRVLHPQAQVVVKSRGVAAGSAPPHCVRKGWPSHSDMAGVYLLHASVSAACGPCQTAGPTSPAAQPAWLAALKKERDSVLASINYTGGVFANPSLGWTQGAYIQPQAPQAG